MNEKNSYWYQLKDDFIDFLREKGYSITFAAKDRKA